MSKETLFTTQTSNATSGAKAMQGRVATCFAWGTFDTCTVTFQISPDNVEWFDLTDATFTAKGAVNIEVPSSVFVRAEVTSVGAGSSVNALFIDSH